MTDNVQPRAAKRRGNPAWYPGMANSPNPSGRPKGIIDKRMKVTKALMDDAPKIARVVIDAALAGDLQACSIVLQRVAPPLKARTEKVAFEFDPDASITDQARQILSAIAAGELDPDTGKMLLDCLSTVEGIRQVEELEARIRELEERFAA